MRLTIFYRHYFFEDTLIVWIDYTVREIQHITIILQIIFSQFGCEKYLEFILDNYMCAIFCVHIKSVKCEK